MRQANFPLRRQLHPPEKRFSETGKLMHNDLVGAFTMNGHVEDFLISRARKIERALVRKSWTRVHLAEITGYDERTIRNVLGAKPVRDQTVIDICQALGIEPDLEAVSKRLARVDGRGEV